MFQRQSDKTFERERVNGVVFCKSTVDREDCRQLIEDLGCTVLTSKEGRLTIQAARARLQELKSKHTSKENDKADISTRLKGHFDRILIGGPAR